MEETKNRESSSTRERGVGSATGRLSMWMILGELALVAVIFLADWKGFIPLSKTPVLLLLGWASLRLRGLRWRDVGFVRRWKWKRTIWLGVALGIAVEAFQFLVTQPVFAGLLGYQPDISDFAALKGNILLTLLVLALAWTLAAFGEELVWRGYLLNRVADLGLGSKSAWVLSLILVSAAFGLAHGYQGLAGVIVEGISGLLLALMYLGTGKNLAAPIIAHGVADTIDIVLISLGRFPGL